LDKKTSEYFDDVIISARSVFKDIEYNTEVTPERAILQIWGKYNLYRISVTELVDCETRKYRLKSKGSRTLTTLNGKFTLKTVYTVKQRKP